MNKNCTKSHLTNSDVFSHLAGASSLGIGQVQGWEEFGILMTSSLTPGFFSLFALPYLVSQQVFLMGTGWLELA